MKVGDLEELSSGHWLERGEVFSVIGNDERGAAIERWRAWWARVGRNRFGQYR